MSDLQRANGAIGVVWKMGQKRLVQCQPARRVCTVASSTGPAAAEGRIRGGDKLVAIYRPQHTPAAAPSAENCSKDAPGDRAAADTPKKATRSLRVCVVGFEITRVRQLLEGKAGEPVVLEFLRAAECCPSEEALMSPNFGKARNTFTVRVIREPIVDFKYVERSQTVGIKPISDLFAERKLKIALQKARMEQASMLDAKKQRKAKRSEAKLARQDQLARLEEEMRLQEEEQKRLAHEAKVAKAREKVDAKQQIARARAAELRAALQLPSESMDLLLELEEISLDNLQLSAIPEYIQSMSCLTCLHLSNNSINALPGWIGDLENLEQLALGNNKLRELPTEMCKLRNLQHLDVRMNPPFLTPPPNVWEMSPLSQKHAGYVDPSLVLTYLQMCHDDLVEIEGDQSDDSDAEDTMTNEDQGRSELGAKVVRRNIRQNHGGIQKTCSVVFVGEACTGKSACLRLLKNPASVQLGGVYNPTHGMVVGEWTPFEWLTHRDQDYIKVVTVDCSGQAAYRHVLDLAMPPNSLYILVWTPRPPTAAGMRKVFGEQEQEIIAGDDSVGTYLKETTHEWLCLIQSRAPGASVLLVCNCREEEFTHTNTSKLVTLVQHQTLESISAMAGGPGGGSGGSRKWRKLNVLFGGQSLNVDVTTGAAVDVLRKEIVAVLTEGTYVRGKVPLRFLRLHHLVREHRYSIERPAGAILERELVKLASDKCGITDKVSLKLAIDYLLHFQDMRVLDLKTLGIPDKLYMTISEITDVVSDLMRPECSRLDDLTSLNSQGNDKLDLLLTRGIASEQLLKQIWSYRDTKGDDSDGEAKSTVSEEEHARCKRAIQALCLMLKVEESTYHVPLLQSPYLCECDARSVGNTQALLTLKTEFDFMPSGAFSRLLVIFARYLPGATVDYLPVGLNSPCIGGSACKSSVHSTLAVRDAAMMSLERGEGERRALSGGLVREMASLFWRGTKVSLAAVEQTQQNKKRLVLLGTFSHRKHLSHFLDSLVCLEESFFPGLFRSSMHFLYAGSGHIGGLLTWPSHPSSRREEQISEWIDWPLDQHGVPKKVETWRSAADDKWDMVGTTPEPEKQVRESLSRIKFPTEPEAALIFVIHSGRESLWPNRHDFPLLDKCSRELTLSDMGLCQGRKVWTYKMEGVGTNERGKKSTHMHEAVFTSTMAGNKIQVTFTADKTHQVIPRAWLIRDAENEAQKMVLEVARELDLSVGLSYDDRAERMDGLLPVELARVALIFVDPSLRSVWRSKHLIQQALDQCLPSILVLLPDDDGFMPTSNQFTSIFGGRAIEDHPCTFMCKTMGELQQELPRIVAKLQQVLAVSKGAAPHTEPDSYFCHQAPEKWVFYCGEERGKVQKETEQGNLSAIQSRSNREDYWSAVCPHCINEGVYPPYTFRRTLYSSQLLPTETGSEGMGGKGDAQSPVFHMRTLTTPMFCPFARDKIGEVMDVFPPRILLVSEKGSWEMSGKMQRAIEDSLEVRCLRLRLDVDGVAAVPSYQTAPHDADPTVDTNDKLSSVYSRLINRAQCIVLVLPRYQTPSLESSLLTHESSLSIRTKSSDQRTLLWRELLLHMRKRQVVSVLPARDADDDLQDLAARATAATVVSLTRLPSSAASLLFSALREVRKLKAMDYVT